MKTVKILLVSADVPGAHAWGEVKAVDASGDPTVASPDVAASASNLFHANPGRHCFQFSVGPRCHLTLSTEIDGAEVGPRVDFDATLITAGRRYVFEVPS